MTDGRELRELVEQLVRIDSVNPTLVDGGAGEAELARFVAAWLERAGLGVTVVGPAGRPSVIARARGSGGGRALLLNGHLDTVGLGGPDAGLVPRVDGDRLYGRGAYDMKGSLAALMLAAAAVAGSPPAGDVVLTAVSDEEDASVGTGEALRHVTADGAVVAEPTDLRLAVAHRGFVWLEVETRGRAAHGSRWDLGVDAIALMGRVLVGLDGLAASLREGPAHALLGPASVHASLIEGGRELSTYPERCLLQVERRTLPGESAEDAEAELRALGADAGASVRSFFSRRPLETPPDAEIVRALAAAAAGVLGAEPDVVGVPFWTDAGLIGEAGIPVAVLGPVGEGAHAEAEWVDLPSLESLRRILLETVRAFCA